MDRLIAANSVPMAQADTAPLTGTPQGATDGNPASNIPATRWPSYQYNAIQEELIAILTAAGITPDRTNNAQILAAIRALQGIGPLLSITMYSTAGSSSFQPSTANSSIYTRAMGGGGAGGSTPATGANQYAIASGGSSGAYAEGFYQLTSASPIAITIGAGGTAVANSAGNNGGTTSVGSLMTCPGGIGGSTSGAQSTSVPWATGVNMATLATGGNIVNTQGWPANLAFAVQASTGSTGILCGGGGPSPFGNSVASNNVGTNVAGATGIYGGGGRGVAQTASAAALLGGAGGAGWALLFEFGRK